MLVPVQNANSLEDLKKVQALWHENMDNLETKGFENQAIKIYEHQRENIRCLMDFNILITKKESKSRNTKIDLK